MGARWGTASKGDFGPRRRKGLKIGEGQKELTRRTNKGLKNRKRKRKRNPKFLPSGLGRGDFLTKEFEENLLCRNDKNGRIRTAIGEN